MDEPQAQIAQDQAEVKALEADIAKLETESPAVEPAAVAAPIIEPPRSRFQAILCE